MEGVTIRRAVEADLEEAMRLERRTATAPHWGVGEYEAIVRGDGARRAMFVARAGEALTGFAVGSVAAGEGELESVVVREGERRRGVGRALCSEVMGWARAEGAGEITLEVRVESVGAVWMYEGLGFVASGRRVGYYSEPRGDGLVMRFAFGGEGVEAV